MRSDVIRRPPPTRLRTVVVREGPPRGRRPTWDRILGALGLLLLLLSVAVVPGLAPRDVFLPQYEVRVDQVQVNLTTESTGFLAQGDKAGVVYNVPADNVFFILLDVGFADDVPGSEPDIFEVVLLDPNNNPVGDSAQVVSELGAPNRTSLVWEVPHTSARLSFDLEPPPEGDFMRGATVDATAEDVAAAFMAQHHRRTTGDWTVQVRMLQAGKCPGLPDPPTGVPDQEDLEAFLLRRQACPGDPTGNADDDPGNNFTIELFQYTYFDARALPV